MSRESTTEAYLAAEIIQADKEHASRSHRLVFALAGIPGSGKSTIAGKVEQLVEEALGPGTMVIVGMDGYHLTKAALTKMPNPHEALARRGAPWTFDADGFVQLVHQVQTSFLDDPISFSTFDHAIADPDPHGGCIQPGVRIVLFEGLYLALDTPPWVHLNHFTARWFLDCPLSIAMHRLIHRHITAGLSKDENEARARIQSNDALNAQFILDHLIPTVTHLPFSHS
ncbi:MAG: phosphoribulokinase/uridine kinase [Piptocephalis tieghemiana]|nr:MAG: phosphoribulokinase/uridine kinase [Piptocephalis tieghemiana]